MQPLHAPCFLPLGALATALVLCGCATVTPTDPIIAGAELEDQPIPVGKALVVFTTNVVAGTASFHAVPEDDQCPSVYKDVLARVQLTTEEAKRDREFRRELSKFSLGLLPALGEPPQFQFALVDAEKPLQIAGRSYYQDPRVQYSCGPISFRFVPRSGAKYQAFFRYQSVGGGGACGVDLNELGPQKELLKVGQQRWDCESGWFGITRTPSNFREIK